MKETEHTVLTIFAEAYEDVKLKDNGEMFPLIYLDDFKETIDQMVEAGNENTMVTSAYFVKVQKSAVSIQGNPYGTVLGTVRDAFPVKTIDDEEDNPSLFELVLEHKSFNKITTVSELKKIVDRAVEDGYGNCIVCTQDQYNEDGSYWLLEYIETESNEHPEFTLWFREVIN